MNGNEVGREYDVERIGGKREGSEVHLSFREKPVGGDMIGRMMKGGDSQAAKYPRRMEIKLLAI